MLRENIDCSIHSRLDLGIVHGNNNKKHRKDAVLCIKRATVRQDAKADGQFGGLSVLTLTPELLQDRQTPYDARARTRSDSTYSVVTSN